MAPGCIGCTSFAPLGAPAWRSTAKWSVEVSSLAVSEFNASDLLAHVKGNDATRGALKKADLIVVQLGVNESPWNGIDDRAAPHRRSRDPVVRDHRRLNPARGSRLRADPREHPRRDLAASLRHARDAASHHRL